MTRTTNNQPIESVIVTPEIALEWLTDKNKINRPLSKHHVAQLAHDMMNGMWRNTAVPIIFDKEGFLIDGQHRLTALFDAGLTFPFYVAYDRDASEREVTDIGNRRNLKDIMSFGLDTPHYYARYYAMAARAAFIGIESGRTKLATTATLLAFHKAHQDSFDFLFEHAPLSSTNKKSPCMRAAVMGNLIRAFYNTAQKARLVSFIEILHTGLYDNSDPSAEAVVNLRNALLTAPLKRSRSAIRIASIDTLLYGKVQRVLLAHIKREAVSRPMPVTFEHFLLPAEKPNRTAQQQKAALRLRSQKATKK